jgi:hypothetical protein
VRPLAYAQRDRDFDRNCDAHPLSDTDLVAAADADGELNRDGYAIASAYSDVRPKLDGDGTCQSHANSKSDPDAHRDILADPIVDRSSQRYRDEDSYADL